MGFNLVLNFNNPYLATGLGDFWSRWHISLSTWFRDYVYIPLGGNRRGASVTYRNLFIVFLISGIWHGCGMDLRHLGAASRRRHHADPRAGAIRVLSRPRAADAEAGMGFPVRLFRLDLLPSRLTSDAALIVGRIVNGGWEHPQIPALMVLLVAAVWLYQLTYESRLRVC